jgi:hypothetical protein
MTRTQAVYAMVAGIDVESRHDENFRTGTIKSIHTNFAVVHWDNGEISDAEPVWELHFSYKPPFDVVTVNVYPPIPDRRWDWFAHLEGREEETGAPCGWGSTEAAAISDLMSEIEEKRHDL